MKRINILPLIATFILVSCGNKDNANDAFGNFEAIEIIVSAENNGKLLSFDIDEGYRVDSGEVVGLIDTLQLNLQKTQIQTSIKSLYAKIPEIKPQIDVLKQKLDKAEFELARNQRLVKSGAVPKKIIDDYTAEILVIKRQIDATVSTLTTQQQSILSEIKPMEAQIDIIEDLISRSIITNPIKGTVLTRFAHAGELASQGKPLYKIADVDNIILRAYIGEQQLGDVEIGKTVSVLTDNSQGEFDTTQGVITWISSKAEFTPKVIQTKEQRINLVYAIKIDVKNSNGKYKIGMPAEVKF